MIPTITHIRARECPVCLEGRIRRVEIRDLHTCGQWNEYLEFNCGYTEHYSPNFHHVLVKQPCGHAMKTALDLRKQLQKEK